MNPSKECSLWIRTAETHLKNLFPLGNSIEKAKMNSPHHRLQKKNFDSPSKKRKQTENNYPRESTLEVGEHAMEEI